MTRNKKIIILGTVVVILLIGFFLIWNPFYGFYGVEEPKRIGYDYKLTEPIGGVGVRGIITDISPSAKVITMFDGAKNKEIYLALTDDTKLFNKSYRLVNLSYFQVGFVVEAVGEMTNETSLIPSEVYIRQEMENPCAVCINGCDTCPEGCEECLIGIEKKEKDPNMKWYYNPELP